MGPPGADPLGGGRLVRARHRTGQPGSAVILGHVDSKGGPAVFFRLRQLRQGDMVTVRRADGSSVRFVVQRTEQYPKDRFPTDAVYYPTLTPGLHLVTCGGQFDATVGRQITLETAH
jgi:hypothetical protein